MPPNKRKTATPAAAPDDTEADSAALNPADAAVAEVEAETDDGKLTVEFRGEKFEIDRTVFTSARFLLSLRRFRYQDILFEVLGPDENTDRFIGLVKFKEQIPDVANEFLASLNAAAGWGNSSTS